MSKLTEFSQVYAAPPVIETRLAVQFDPLLPFISGYFGLIWEKCFGVDQWRIRPDRPPRETEYERFGSKLLNPPSGEEQTGFPQVCMELTNATGDRKIELQANRLTYGWNRRVPSGGDGYSTVKAEFDAHVAKFQEVLSRYEIGTLAPNLWDVTYVNQIQRGGLWGEPRDWHQVLPGLFPSNGPHVEGLDWSTFTGRWVFVIPPDLGRVHVRVQKAVAAPTEEVCLLIVVSAKGEIGPHGSADWSSGINLGHEAANKVFDGLVSSEARRAWGRQF